MAEQRIERPSALATTARPWTRCGAGRGGQRRDADQASLFDPALAAKATTYRCGVCREFAEHWYRTEHGDATPETPLAAEEAADLIRSRTDRHPSDLKRPEGGVTSSVAYGPRGFGPRADRGD